MIGAIAVGGAMAAGGAAALARSMKQKTKPKGVSYGGSQSATDNYRDVYTQKMGEGEGVRNLGLDATADVGQRGRFMSQDGRGIMMGALDRSTPIDQRGSQHLNAYDPQKLVQMQSQATTDEMARQNLAAAGSGDALSMRNAVNANAEMGIRAAQQAGISAEAAQAAKLGAQVDQFNQEYNQRATNEAQALQEANLGLALQNQGMGYQAGSAQGLTSAGLTMEQANQANLQHVEDAQTQLLLDYEKRRQADGIRKAQNLWGLGAGLVGAGGNVMAAGMGGGKGA